MKFLIKALIITLFLTIFSTSCSNFGAERTHNVKESISPELEISKATVIRVTDGDTVVLDIEGNEEKVRLIGIDAPESVANISPIQCYGEEASQYLKGLLPEGTTVNISADIEARDKYDRLLLYIYLENGDFVNELLVSNGFANAQSYKPNITKQNILDDALDEAKSNKVGLWATCDGPDDPL